MTRNRLGGLSPLLNVLLVLLVAPMVVLAALWVTFVLAGLFQARGLDNVRDAILFCMTLALAGAATCVFVEFLVAPLVLRFARVSHRWATTAWTLRRNKAR